METKDKFILNTVHVVFWVIFIGLCIKSMALLIALLVSLFVNPEGARNLYSELDLYTLYQLDTRHYVSVVSFMIVLSGLKAYIAYLVIKIFSRFDFTRPFDANVSLLITEISHVALRTGVVALVANGYSDWLIKKGVAVQQDWGSSEFLFLAGVLFIVAQVFKRGVEFQAENELTV
ncbi:DUF2975 domain-containing protein [Hymenobacter sp. HDW8]|uniref:DUF2975 domain-containing protein n=1 Tax=Hymenobacter sp. HDW8 TaxID=2714932 RepID=UPI00140A26A4|nr:DUF2975 domain-containing protein [Hymenobacter sp. HDW8]QIL76667.1 DUF2975 domain-containing protein [Hymenobacter sp. HDW8]